MTIRRRRAALVAAAISIVLASTNTAATSAAAVHAGATTGGHLSASTASTDTQPRGWRHSGTDRYATAAAAVHWRYFHPATEPLPGAVVLVDGSTAGVDALSASYLAGVVNAPVLLTSPGTVPPVTIRAIHQLQPRTIYVVGGRASVSDASLVELATTSRIVRVAGADRYATAAAVMHTALSLGAPVPNQVFLARADQPRGEISADALAASAVAYREKIPVLLTAREDLPPATADALATVTPEVVTALGSPASISQAAAQDAVQAGSSRLDRLSGMDRGDTAALISERWCPGANELHLANGYRVDALAAGPVAGALGACVLLTPSERELGAGAERYVRNNAATLRSYQLYGDSQALGLEPVWSMRRLDPDLPDSTLSFRNTSSGELHVTLDQLYVDPVELGFSTFSSEFGWTWFPISPADSFPAQNDWESFLLWLEANGSASVRIDRDASGHQTVIGVPAAR